MLQDACIVIPCYNEANRISEQVYIDALSVHSWMHLLFVDDGSEDETSTILYKIQSCFSHRVFVLQLERNNGKAEAVRAGVLRAVEWKEFALLGYLDADLATPFSELSRMYTAMPTDVDSLFLGSRAFPSVDAEIIVSFKRRLIRYVFGIVLSLFFDLSFKDTQCGAKLFSSSLAKIMFQKPFISEWLFDIELLFRVSQKSENSKSEVVIREFPLKYWQEKGNSRLRVRDFLKAPFELWSIWKYYRS